MVPDREQLLLALAALGETPEAITDVILSHHHPDHTLNAALFPNARVHDHWGIYHGDEWLQRSADGELVSPSIRLIETPGHTPQDVTTLVGTPQGIAAFSHLWLSEKGRPPTGTLGADDAALHRSRERVLKVASHHSGARRGIPSQQGNYSVMHIQAPRRLVTLSALCNSGAGEKERTIVDRSNLDRLVR